MAEIKFKKKKLITSIVLCLAFMIFLVYATIYASNSYKPISILLLLIAIHILYFHNIKALKLYYKGYFGIKVNEFGITNNTQDTNIFIPFEEIVEFRNGYYRSQNQIYIVTVHPQKYNQVERSTYLHYFNKVGMFFRSKPDLLWIDVNLLDITETELLSLLRSKLNKLKDQ